MTTFIIVAAALLAVTAIYATLRRFAQITGIEGEV